MLCFNGKSLQFNFRRKLILFLQNSQLEFVNPLKMVAFPGKNQVKTVAFPAKKPQNKKAALRKECSLLSSEDLNQFQIFKLLNF